LYGIRFASNTWCYILLVYSGYSIKEKLAGNRKDVSVEVNFTISVEWEGNGTGFLFGRTVILRIYMLNCIILAGRYEECTYNLGLNT
jgi:hypothetical protein